MAGSDYPTIAHYNDDQRLILRILDRWCTAGYEPAMPGHIPGRMTIVPTDLLLATWMLEYELPKHKNEREKKAAEEVLYFWLYASERFFIGLERCQKLGLVKRSEQDVFPILCGLSCRCTRGTLTCSRAADDPDQARVTVQSDRSPLSWLAQDRGCYELTREGIIVCQRASCPQPIESAPKRPPVDYQDIQRRLQRLQSSGEQYTNYRGLAEQLGCSVATISKAFKRSARLQRWNKTGHRGPPRATGLSKVVTDNTKQTREPDPSEAATDDELGAIFAELLDGADDKARARINAMSPNEQAELCKAVRDQKQDTDRVRQPKRV